MHNVTAIILAAGKGSRMKSDKAKVLHELAGKSLVHHVLDACLMANIDDVVVVVGHDHESVIAALEGRPVRFAHQYEQKGTGHAVSFAETMTERETILVLCGDSPFVGHQTLRDLIQAHHDQRNACTVIGASLSDPTGYGRLIVNDSGQLTKIVEQKDASALEREITLVNSGAYVFNRDLLFGALRGLEPTNAQGEYYLTDVIHALAAQQLPVGLLIAEDPRTVLGINTPQQLVEAEMLLRG